MKVANVLQDQGLVSLDSFLLLHQRLLSRELKFNYKCFDAVGFMLSVTSNDSLSHHSNPVGRINVGNVHFLYTASCFFRLYCNIYVVTVLFLQSTCRRLERLCSGLPHQHGWKLSQHLVTSTCCFRLQIVPTPRQQCGVLWPLTQLENVPTSH